MAETRRATEPPEFGYGFYGKSSGSRDHHRRGEMDGSCTARSATFGNSDIDEGCAAGLDGDVGAAEIAAARVGAKAASRSI